MLSAMIPTKTVSVKLQWDGSLQQCVLLST